jgi:hypothetical protein
MEKLPIGLSDFKELISGNYYFIDKSLFIKEIVDSGAKVTLIPRPRRFGKTLNLSMLQYFFEQNETSQRHLFDNLEISKHPEIMEQQGQHPVIFLTFKDIKQSSWVDCYDKIKQLISNEFSKHSFLLESDILNSMQKQKFQDVISCTASQASYENSIKDLSEYLAKYHNQNPIILIDEYDSPIQAGFLHDYYNQVVGFTRGLMCSGLKDNTFLNFSVITGILRVAKESIFSGMNNLKVCSLLSDNYADKFGFTESEVNDLIATYQLSSKLDNIRAWYNGYRIGQPRKTNTFTMVYNPWSILNFVSEKGTFGDYWVNTSDNKIIQELVQKASEDVKKDFELVLTGQPVSKTIAEDISFLTIHNDSDALWSFLVFSGYLTWESRELMQIRCQADLIAPNIEVLDCLKRLVNQWFTESIGGGAYKNMLEALKQGDVPSFKRFFEQSVLTHLSYFDITGQTPERIYHAYVLGLLVGLSATHEVKSNRESGLGRYDVCVIPLDKSKAGTIIEFKAFNPEQDKDMQAAASAALAQIEENKYETELRSRGIEKIIKLAIIFEGKRVLIVSK